MCIISMDSVHVTSFPSCMIREAEPERVVKHPISLLQSWTWGEGWKRDCSVFLVVIFPQLHEKASAMRIQKDETTKCPSRCLFYNKLRSSDLLDCDFLFPFTASHSWTLAQSLLGVQSISREKRKMHADPVPLFITALCWGIFHRKAKNCLMSEHLQNTEPWLLPGPI